MTRAQDLSKDIFASREKFIYIKSVIKHFIHAFGCPSSIFNAVGAPRNSYVIVVLSKLDKEVFFLGLKPFRYEITISNMLCVSSY